MADKPTPDLTELGSTGLRRSGGTVYEEFLVNLRGIRGAKTYREMADNDPTACVAVYSDGEAFLLDEVLYQNGLSNRQIFQLLESEVGKNTVIADSAEPKSIDELHGYGMNVHPARKGPDSVRAGIPSSV